MTFRCPPIFMYHSVSRLASDPNMICTSPERFEKQMLFLKQRGFQGVSVSELMRKAMAGRARKLVGLTFDDAYKDFLTTAMPTLERLDFRATVFVVAGLVENDWEHAHPPRPSLDLLGFEELSAVREHGIEIGSHSMTHPKLPEVEPERLEREVNDSRRVLSEALDEAIEGFCYPYGSVDLAALQSVRRAGYAYACAWNRPVEGGVYDLPRIPVSNRDSSLRFATKIRVYPQYCRVKRLIKN